MAHTNDSSPSTLSGSNDQPHTGNQPKYLQAFILVTSLFFMWGFITVLVDSLIPRLREVFEISHGTSGLLQTAFFLAYFVVAFPAGWLLSKLGYKRGMMIGLAIMGVGCLLYFPAASFRLFPLFLVAMFTLAGGMAILQVAANPYVSVLGAERNASSRLNLAQAFNSLGTTIAPIVGAAFILRDRVKNSVDISALDDAAKEAYYAAEAAAVQMPFVWLAGSLFVLAAIVMMAKLPTVLGSGTTGGYGAAFKNPRLRLGALAIFVYVGAEVAIGTYAVSYFVDMHLDEMIRSNETLASLAQFILRKDLAEVDGKGIAGAFVALYWFGAMVGRFVGSYLTAAFSPARVLSVFAVSAIGLIVISMATSGYVAMWSLLAVGLFNSIMFPTIFTLAIDGLGDLKPQGSGILVAAILGGGVVPPLYGWLADSMSFKPAFVVVLLCYAFILAYAWLSPKLEKKT